MPTAEEYFAAMDAAEERAARAHALHCTAEHCEYIDKVGLIAGVDVDIDGGVWPNSPFAAHIAMCPADGYPKRDREEGQ